MLVFDDSDALMERLLYGPGVDQPLAAEDGSGDVTWLLADHQGTIRDVVEYDDANDTTTVVNHLQYSSFGQITSQTDSAYEPRHTYTGREWDADVDLYYYRARWYDAAVGRFISEDPIGFAAGDANVSRYVGNSAVNLTDPSGLAASDGQAVATLNPTDYSEAYELVASMNTGTGGDVTTAGWKWDDIPTMLMNPMATSYGASVGIGHGTAMVANAATLHQIEPLDNYVDGIVDQNGGVYQAANVSAHVGVFAAELAAALAVIPALIPQGAFVLEVGSLSVSGGELALVGGATIVLDATLVAETTATIALSSLLFSSLSSDYDFPSIDGTGKVHGSLPSPKDFRSWANRQMREDLLRLLAELKQSIPQRHRMTVSKGADTGHSVRIQHEEALIAFLERFLFP